MVWNFNNSTTQKIGRFEVVTDDVTLPNGDQKAFSFLHFAKGVCVLPITDDHQVLCIKQYRHALKSWQWELPAGAIENEDTPIETAKRELQEETGFLAEHWLDLGSFYPSPGSTSEEIFLFAAAGLTASEQKLENSEQIELQTITMEELKSLIVEGDFNHGAGLAAVLRYKFKTD